MKIIEQMKKRKFLTAVILIYIILLILNPDKGLMALKNTSYYLLELIQVIPIIMVLTIVIEAWVPKEVITKGLGSHSGLKGNIYAFILGSVSAGPIYAAFPICKMLMKKGASITNSIIIISAWAVIKVPMLANEAKFLGFRFMAIRWVLTVVAILIMAYIGNWLIKREDIPQENEEEVIGIKEAYCVGCGLCVRKAPEYFEIYGGKAKMTNQTPATVEELKKFLDIQEKCPAKAITYHNPDNNLQS